MIEREPFDKEAFEERAAIMEFDAGMPRAKAEAMARVDVIRRNRRPTAEASMGTSASGEVGCLPEPGLHNT